MYELSIVTKHKLEKAKLTWIEVGNMLLAFAGVLVVTVSSTAIASANESEFLYGVIFAIVSVFCGISMLCVAGFGIFSFASMDSRLSKTYTAALIFPLVLSLICTIFAFIALSKSKVDDQTNWSNWSIGLSLLIVLGILSCFLCSRKNYANLLRLKEASISRGGHYSMSIRRESRVPVEEYGEVEAAAKLAEILK